MRRLGNGVRQRPLGRSSVALVEEPGGTALADPPSSLLPPIFVTPEEAPAEGSPAEVVEPTGVVVMPPMPPPTEVVPWVIVTPPGEPTEAVPAVEVAGEPTVEDPTANIAVRPLRTPIIVRRRPKRRVRKVTRVVRHIDTWSVFKVALVFNAFLYAVCLTAGVLLWQVATSTGTIDNVQKFFEGFGWSSFKFHGGQIFHNAWVAGLFVSVGLTGLAVLTATLFNLITDLVGGVRVTVLEEEVVPRQARQPRQWPAKRPGPPIVIKPTPDPD